ncbi:MAG: hypothetical protein ACOYK1_00805 [Vampirovibrionia bacterium]
MLNTALSLNTSAALETYIQTLSGKRISDLEQSAELRNFVKEYQSKYGFHLHLKNGDELDPCDGDHHHKPSTDMLQSLHGEPKHDTKHDHANDGYKHEIKHKKEEHHTHNHAHDKPAKGFLEKLLNNISENKSIPKTFKPLLIRGTINLANIFLAQSLSVPLHHIHTPSELTSSSAVAAMHLLNYGTNKWESLAKNLFTIVPFVALHRLVKVPNFVMRSALGFVISLSEQLSSSDNQKTKMEKFKDAFNKDAGKFLSKLLQMETMLNTAIPLGQSIAKKIPNKALAFVSQNLAMAGAFTVIPELFSLFKNKTANNPHAALDHSALTAELLECAVCGEAHGADFHLLEISEGVSLAGANNASDQDHLHSLIHHGGVL